MRSFPFYRILRRNPSSGTTPGAFTLAEIAELSRYPGRSSERSKLAAKMHRATGLAENKILLSPLYNKRYDWSKKPMFAYQLAGVAYVLEQARRGQNRTAIFDLMGLGKTHQGVGSLLALGDDAFPAVVVAPKATLSSWKGVLKSLVLADVDMGRKGGGATATEILEGLRRGKKRTIYLTHYTHLQDLGKDVEEGRAPAVPQFGMFLADEAHEIRNPDSKQTRGAQHLLANARYTLLLTGTPALKSALEVLPLLKTLEKDESGLYRPYWTQAEARDDADRWGSVTGVSVIPMMGGYRDVTYPKDAGRLEERLRRVSSRRSRKAVSDMAAAPTSKIQPFKHRSFETIPPDPRYANLSAQLFLAQVQAEDAKKAFSGSSGVGTFSALRGAAESLDEKMQKLLSSRSGIHYRYTNKDDFREAVEKSPEHLRVLQAARQSYMAIPQGTGDSDDGDSDEKGFSIRKEMGRVAADYAPTLQSKYGTKSDLVFVTFYYDNVVHLRDRLQDSLRGGDKNREVYVYTGKPELNGIYKGGKQIQRGLSAKQLQHAFRILVKTDSKGNLIKSVRPPGPYKSAIITSAAKAGVNLPSANYLFMLDRQYAPGLDEQMEDRINRAGRIGESRIVYIIPEDVYAFALAHRLENRRLSLAYMFGEDFAAAKTEPLQFARKLRSLQREWQDSKDPLDHRRAEVLDNLLFTEDPEGYLEKRVSAFWKIEADRRAAEEKKSKKAREERLDCAVKVQQDGFGLGELHKLWGLPECSQDPKARINWVWYDATGDLAGITKGIVGEKGQGKSVILLDGSLKPASSNVFYVDDTKDHVVHSVEELTPQQVARIRKGDVQMNPQRAQTRRSRKPRRRRRRRS